MTAGARAALAAALLLSAGCAKYITTAPRPDPNVGDWGRLRAAHTREAKLYDGLATRAFATATWETPSVRAARVERVAEWKAMTAAERAALEAEEAGAAARFEEFTLALFTADRTDNDLDASGTGWRIAVVRPDGSEATATEVRQLRGDAMIRTLYPFVGDFDTVYRLRFPKAPGARAMTLLLAGPRGRIELPFVDAAATPAS